MEFCISEFQWCWAVLPYALSFWTFLNSHFTYFCHLLFSIILPSSFWFVNSYFFSRDKALTYIKRQKRVHEIQPLAARESPWPVDPLQRWTPHIPVGATVRHPAHSLNLTHICQESFVNQWNTPRLCIILSLSLALELYFQNVIK